MEPPALRYLVTFLCVFLFSQSQANPTFNSDEIKARFETMECIVKPRYTPITESYIKGYLSNSSSGKGARVMGRAVVYFPIFEKYLSEHSLPQDLKALAILESALLPKATSPVGAGGLWQFMRETGRAFGLQIDENVDERSCAYRSTEAAMKYLAKHFERYGNWEMALASYNCGAGTINHAIKRARSEDYWKVSKYLPRETQNFVPAFLAATYIVNFYHLHDIKPQFPNLDMQLTESVKIYTSVHFSTVAAITGLPVDIVTELNPAFKNGFVPAHPEGHYLVLPRRVMLAFNDYLLLIRPDNGASNAIIELPTLHDISTYLPDELYFKSIYTVAEGDFMEDLANIFSCTAYNIKAWNELTSNHLSRGKELFIWFPNELLRFRPTNQRIQVMPPASAVTTSEKAPQPKIQQIEDVKIVPTIESTTPGIPAAKGGSPEQSAIPAPAEIKDKCLTISLPRFYVTEEDFNAAADLLRLELASVVVVSTQER